jgi:hypothetical protein
MALPTFVAKGTASGSTAAITPGLPAGIQVNDILLLYLETSDETISIANQNGGTWAAVPDSPKSASPTRITVFWSRYNGTQGAPTTSDSGNHQYGVILAYRGCPTTGDPWNATAASDFATIADNLIGVTTTVADCLIVQAAVDDQDTASAHFSGYTNSNLSSITERHDAGTTQGNGGGLGIIDGGFSGTGATGNTAFTYSGSGTNNAYHTIALQPAATGQTISVGQVTETDTAQAIAWAPKHRLVNQVTETDTAQVMTRRKSVLVAQVSESDLCQGISPSRRYPVVQVSEVDLAQALIAPKFITVEQVSEVDLAQTILHGQIISVAQVSEVDTAQALAWAPKNRLVARVTEIDLAQSIVVFVPGAGVGGDYILLRRRRRS